MLNLTHLWSWKHEEKVCILAHCDFTCATNTRFNTLNLQRGMVEIFSPQLSLLIHLPPASLHQRKPYKKDACLSASSPFLELHCCSRNKQCSTTEFSVNNAKPLSFDFTAASILLELIDVLPFWHPLSLTSRLPCPKDTGYA